MMAEIEEAPAVRIGKSRLNPADVFVVGGNSPRLHRPRGGEGYFPS